MLNTFKGSEIADLKRRIPLLQRDAECEKNLRAANASLGRFEGATELLAAASAKLVDLQRAEEGRALSRAIDELSQIDTELELVGKERDDANARVAEASQTDIIRRWLTAPSIAIRFGYGHSWGSPTPPYADSFSFCAWYVSGKPRNNGLSESASWFLGPEAPEVLRFNLAADREAVCRYQTLRHEAALAAMRWSDLAERRRLLLQLHPELQGAA